jgi:hypothetical protein
LHAYRHQQVTEVFDLRHLIGSTPQATLFQASFCLLLYNLIQVVKAYVARAGARPIRQVSAEKLFADCQKQMVTWATVGESAWATEHLGLPMSSPQVRQRLEQLLGGQWRERWLKAPPQPTRRSTRKTVFPSKGYTNVWKVLSAQQPTRRRDKAKQLS